MQSELVAAGLLTNNPFRLGQVWNAAKSVIVWRVALAGSFSGVTGNGQYPNRQGRVAHLARTRGAGALTRGISIADIGTESGISGHTVGDHAKSIYRKLNISSRAEAALRAKNMGLV